MWITFQGPDGPHIVEIGAEDTIVGRADDCAVTLDDPKVSRHHAALRALGDGRLEVRDLGSSNGTFVGERRIAATEYVWEGALLRVGHTVMAVHAAAPVAGSPTSIEPVVPAPTPAPPTPTPPTPAPPTPAPAAAPARGRSVVDRSKSVIERVRLDRAVRRATIIGGIAVVLGLVAIGLLVVNPGGDDANKPPTTAEIVDAITPSTVLVLMNKDGERAGNGTGWVLDADRGLIVTNAHVVNGGTEIKIGFNGEERPAKVLGVAPCDDLAVLQVDKTDGLKTLPLGSQSTLRGGDTVVALGFPGTASAKDELTTTTGVVSRPHTTFDLQAPDVPAYPDVVQTDAAINPGNSGGPLVNQQIQLVGVNSSLGLPNTQNQNYAIGVDRVKEVVPALVARKSSGWTGMQLEYVDPAKLAAKGLPEGILVPDAFPGTPAAKAGLDTGDPVLLTAINGGAVGSTLQGYCRQIKALGDRSDAVFTFVSGSGRSQDVRIPFA